ncbi:MAG: hypothetical protein HC908_00175 [Calothrix sp. SM1_7_51]|nr:hypothetical protein [Calothrix sp. SM1_7_51]
MPIPPVLGRRDATPQENLNVYLFGIPWAGGTPTPQENVNVYLFGIP